ncbi:MAG: DUF58 domain-containing protein [Pirellulales bacterium]
MRFKRRIMITPEGGYYLFVMSFVFTGAVLREINLMLVLAGMMLGPLVYNARTARRMTRRLAVRRRLPDSATAGEPVTVELALSSKSRFSGIGLVDAIQRRGGEMPAVRANASPALAEAKAGQPTVVRYRLVPARRGEYRFGPLLVRSSFPFGLIRRTVEHELPGTLLVFPRLGALTARFSALVRDAAHDTSGARRQTYGAGDFYGLRDYRSGDSRRHIHWRTSARRGKLMVRQFERAVHHDVAVYVDLWQPSEPSDEDREHVERAVSFAATLVQDLCRRDGCRVWLAIAAAAAAPLEGVASAWLVREAMSRLACAEPSSRSFDRDRWTSSVAQAPRRAMPVLVTSRKQTPTVADLTRLAAAPGQRSSAERLVCVSTRDAAFGEVFRLDAPTPLSSSFAQEL